MNHNKALIIVDAQRGFIPAEEGERLGVAGFGELPAPDGHTIVPVLNRITKVFAEHGMFIATTGDAHLPGTAHIAEQPNFVDTWPIHAMDGTPGAELHPELLAGHGLAQHYKKGDSIAQSPADDDSYTGVLAHRIEPDTGERVVLPDDLRQQEVLHVYIGGLIVGPADRPYCVDSTAIDLQDQGFDVTVIADGVGALTPEDKISSFNGLRARGIRVVNGLQVVAEVCGTPEVVR